MTNQFLKLSDHIIMDERLWNNWNIHFLLKPIHERSLSTLIDEFYERKHEIIIEEAEDVVLLMVSGIPLT